ncbi:MAG: type II secretion system protein [Candidatus Wallbacteria bacterium HGW-Wallbacteria-1]|jgi:tight adherence protein C|uniref:Type II secretion system protein n=1 Tax=Candidatus Wallbacteria bacterium HGW-Wallbacteria-1 TaxID=2013854 RepID=A0A2N1PPX3_9BACT|nr:MAG: type II secretion system protein [Candidatus Wallbacteria bacterium HGW-Wallbacteria-1]
MGIDVVAMVVVGAIAAFFIFMAVFPDKEEEDIQNRLKQLDAEVTSKDLRKAELQKPFFERVIRPMVSRFANKMDNKKKKSSGTADLKIQLIMAGSPGGLSVSEFQAIRLILALALPSLAVLFVLLLGLPKILVMFGAIIGIMLGVLIPRMYLQKRIAGRQYNILKQLPDVLDLLTVSVEAGLGFDMALAKVCEKMKGVLPDEFKYVLQEVKMGKPRKEALKDMGERLQVDDLSSFLTAIIQAEQLGVSIGNVLRVQSDQMRTRKRQRAEEAAMKAPIKMMLPLVGCIFPVIMIVLLGPAAFRFVTAFSGGGPVR